MRETQLKEERDVVCDFLISRGLETHKVLLQNRHPPEPDILFTGGDAGNVAYELVRLVMRDEEHQLNRVAELEKDCNAFAATILGPQFAGASISLSLSFSESPRRLKGKLEKLYRWMNSLPHDFSGSVEITPPLLQATVHALHIERNSSALQVTVAPQCIPLCDPTVPLIVEKLNKVYQSEYPMELLAYIPFCSVFPAECWRTSLRDYLATSRLRSGFRKVWVFDWQTKCVQFEHPFEL